MEKTFFFGSTLAVLALVGCATPPEPPSPQREAELWSIESTASPAEACANLAKLRYEPSDPTLTDLAAEDARHAEIAGPVRRDIPAGAPLVRIALAGGMTNEGPGGPESLVAWKDAAGVWQVSRVYHAPSRPPSMPNYPPPPKWPEPEGTVEALTGPGMTSTNRDVWSGTLEPAAAAALEAMLAAPCMGRTPARMEPNLVVKGEGIAYCPYDSTFWLIEIRDTNGARRYSQSCRLTGPVGAVAQMLLSARIPMMPKPVYDQSAYYPTDDNPTEQSLHALLAAKLPGYSLQIGNRDEDLKIVAYRPTGRCTADIDLTGPDGSHTNLRHDWLTLYSFSFWAEGTTAGMTFRDGDREVPYLFTAPTYGGAMKIIGVAAWMRTLCTRTGAG